MNAAVVNVLGQPPKYQSFPDPVAGKAKPSSTFAPLGCTRL